MTNPCLLLRLPLALALAASILAGCATPPAPTPTAAAPPETLPIAVPARCMTLVFFGMASPDGAGVSEQQWQVFVGEVVTPRFPAGLTVLEGAGQYLSPGDGRLVSEKSKLVLLVHDGDVASFVKIDQIAAEYRRRYRQEAVLRASIPAVISP